jgi:hypothetical protein
VYGSTVAAVMIVRHLLVITRAAMVINNIVVTALSRSKCSVSIVFWKHFYSSIKLLILLLLAVLLLPVRVYLPMGICHIAPKHYWVYTAKL